MTNDLEILKKLDPVARDFLISVLSSIRLQIDNVIACLKPDPEIVVIDENLTATGMGEPPK